MLVKAPVGSVLYGLVTELIANENVVDAANGDDVNDEKVAFKV